MALRFFQLPPHLSILSLDVVPSHFSTTMLSTRYCRNWKLLLSTTAAHGAAQSPKLQLQYILHDNTTDTLLRTMDAVSVDVDCTQSLERQLQYTLDSHRDAEPHPQSPDAASAAPARRRPAFGSGCVHYGTATLRCSQACASASTYAFVRI